MSAAHRRHAVKNDVIRCAHNGECSGSIMKFLSAAASLFLIIACTDNVATTKPVTETAAPDVLLFVLPSGDSLPYRYLSIGDSSDTPVPQPQVGQALIIHTDERPLGVVHISKLKADEGQGCSDLDQIDFKQRAVNIGNGAFAGSFDINRNNRFRAIIALPAEKFELLQLAEQAIMATSEESNPAYADLLVAARSMAASSPDSGNSLWVYTDGQTPGNYLAVLVATVVHFPRGRQPETTKSTLANFIGVFARTGGDWKLQYSRSHSGCDDCDSRPITYDSIGRGDFNRDGRMDLLLSKSAYETWDYVVLWNYIDGWQEEGIAGGGC